MVGFSLFLDYLAHPECYDGTMLTSLSILLAAFTSVQAEMVRVDIDGMTCIGCADKVTKALDGLSFLSETNTSVPAGSACSSLNGELVESAMSTVITELGYTSKSISIVDTCESEASIFPENWAEVEGLDVAVISHGDEVDLSDHAVMGKFTIYDFGAPWCAPCHVAEKMLKDYLRDHDDVAVRAIVLDSQNPKESFALPAAHQHLRSAPGLPYFVVVNAKGKAVFKGSDVAKLLKKIDKKR
jgi:copper chaperone CopZ